MISDVEVREAGGKGKGVFALRDFGKGEFIFRRRHGRVVRNQDIAALSGQDQMHLCELDWDTSAVLLAPGCYLNHSCDPNAMRSGGEGASGHSHPHWEKRTVRSPRRIRFPCGAC